MDTRKYRNMQAAGISHIPVCVCVGGVSFWPNFLEILEIICCNRTAIIIKLLNVIL